MNGFQAALPRSGTGVFFYGRADFRLLRASQLED